MAAHFGIHDHTQGVTYRNGLTGGIGHVEQVLSTEAGSDVAEDLVCHGVDGKGNPLVGAPNLTDDVWLYGGDPATLKLTIMAGRNGQMPAFGERLGPERVRLLAAYAIHLSESGS